MFRFTIRDVLWLMVVVALALGWFLENRHLRSRAAKAERLSYTYLIVLEKIAYELTDPKVKTLPRAGEIPTEIQVEIAKAKERRAK